ncbi:glycosyltransferase family 4 protein, partial [Dehalococcoidia bacterium]|nr:glycosyltransferase family 4 protein [Dehalococcoidia bacterium]
RGSKGGKEEAMNNLTRHWKLSLLVFPYPEKAGRHILTENLLEILEPLAIEIYLITGNYPQSAIFSPKIHLRNVKHNGKRQSMLTRVPAYIMTQLKLSYHLAKIANRVDAVVFFIGGTALLLPMLTMKLLHKKTILILAGSGARTGKHLYQDSFFGKGAFIFPNLISVLENLTNRLSDRMVVNSSDIIYQLGLEKYRHKISIALPYSLHFDKFKMTKKFDERNNLVGYIGRLSGEKGVLEFVKAIPKILREEKIKFVIGGDGQLRDKIERYIEMEDLKNDVKLAGWIPHDQLPEYLNKLKAIVIPSYTDAGPAIAIEAMACGTPVIAARVGYMPDIIRDAETGFIMENNSPECIAENIIRALNHPNLEKIARNARALVEREYTCEKAVEGYREIFNEVSRGKA